MSAAVAAAAHAAVNAAEVVLGAGRLRLLPSGAAWCEATQSLLVADLHLGKAHSFRRQGVPVPAGTTAQSLAQLSADVQASGAKTIVFLGDFLHARHAQAVMPAVAAWRKQHPHLALWLVRGNHDRHAGDPQFSEPELGDTPLGLSCFDEPLLHGPWALCHHPQTVPGAYALAGHWHPCIALRGKGRDRLRLPCFWLGDPALRPLGVLPAYGAFTGMHPIEQNPQDRVFAIAGDRVMSVHPSPTLLEPT